jgi:hypothetical protein
MVPRTTLIAVLVGVEFALVAMMVQAISPAARAPWDDVSAFRFPGPAESTSAFDHYAFAAGLSPNLTVDIGLADLTIERRNQPGITVTVARHGWHGMGGSAPAITAHQDGEKVTVSSTDDSGWTWSDDRLVTIAVSSGTRVTVQNAGNINALGLRAAASFNSSNGTITVEDFNAPSLQLSSSNGRLKLHNIVAPQLDATSSNGRVEGTALVVRDGRVESSNGRVTLGFAPGADTLVTAATSNGNVRLSGVHATAGSAGSDTDSDDDDGDAPASRTVRIGAGRGRLDVHTSNGNINLSQEG